MVEFKRTTVIDIVPERYICDCCKYIENVDFTDKIKADADFAGFAVIEGTEPAGFGDYTYRKHACSMECTIALVKMHLAPTVKFPTTWAKRKK